MTMEILNLDSGAAEFVCYGLQDSGFISHKLCVGIVW